MWNGLLGEGPEVSPGSSTALRASLETSQSSTILEALYDQGKQIFSVSFRASPDLRYVFYRVPKNIGEGFFETLKQNQSPGKYFHKEIQGKFAFLKESKSKKK